MILGIGVDMVKVSRFERWINDGGMIERYFNEVERFPEARATMQRRCEWYAVRFAAKEAFSKALGTGLHGFDLCDIYILKDKEGMPYLTVTGRAKTLLEERFGCGCRILVSLTHEKEYGLAFVTIEKSGEND